MNLKSSLTYWDLFKKKFRGTIAVWWGAFKFDLSITKTQIRNCSKGDQKMTNHTTELKVKTTTVIKNDFPVIVYTFTDRYKARLVIEKIDLYLRHNIPQVILN